MFYLLGLNKEYDATFADLKRKIQEARLRAAVSVNQELIQLYWTIGKTIVERQENSGWGSKYVEKLAKDLQNEFPGTEGFSRTNVFRMRAFYTTYRNNPPDGGQFQESPPEIFLNIPWRHNTTLIEKLKTSHKKRCWTHTN